MCREALAAYLTCETSITGEPLGWLLDEAETGESVRDGHGQPLLNTHSLPRTLRERVERALEQVRVLDPAVGSGAFPLGMLALLVGVRRTLFRVSGVSVEQQTPLVEGWKRNFIRDCLYGVDIKREAIEIARLRFWLSLVVDADPFEMEPLPNLDFKLMAGDSLIETINGTAIYPTRSLDGETHQLALVESETQRLIHRLCELKDEFFQPAGDRPASAIKQEIVRTEREVVLEALRERERLSLERLNHLSKSLVSTLSTQTNRAEVETLRHDIQTTQLTVADLEAGQTLPLFLYRLHFSSVFEEKDGFDIVIANPPYVRHERVAQETLKTLRATFPSVQNGMADLYVYFYARAVELLHDGGTLAFISPNKFLQAGYGKGLRDLLTGQTQVLVILDLNDAHIFDATTDPCVVITAKGQPVPDHTYRGMAAGSDLRPDELNEVFAEKGQVFTQAQGIRPTSNDTGNIAILIEKMKRQGTSLGRYVNGKIHYGIKTGLNKAFVIDQVIRDRLIAEDKHSVEIIKPFLRGRNIGRYLFNDTHLYLLYIGWRCEISAYPAVLAYLEQYHEKLADRPECRHGHVPWFALSRYAADYHDEFDKTKIIYPVIAMSRRFALDRNGFYLNDKSFFIPLEDYYLLGFLNSKCVWSWIKEKCPVLGNPHNRGRFELRDASMKHLPVPTPTSGQRTRIEELARKLVDHGVEVPEAAIWETEIDHIVYQMFELAPDEIAEVERRAELGKGRGGRQAVKEEED